MITLSAILIIYWIFLAVFAVFVAIGIYHLAMSASLSAVSFIVTLFVIAAGVLTIYGTLALLQGIDWSQPLIGLFTSSNPFNSPVSNF